MALRTLLLRSKLDAKKKTLEELRKKDSDFTTREAEIEAAVNEMTEDTSEEDRQAVEQQAEDFQKEKDEHDQEKKNLETVINEIEEEIRAEEEKKPAPAAGPEERKEGKVETMKTRTKFFNMNIQERDAFLGNEEVKSFLQRTREIGTAAAGGQKRGVTGADLTIPTEVLELIRENITIFSKLVSKVRLRPVSGTARQNIMGTIPEAVWTEMCGKLNELNFGFNQAEVDGYKVGGVIYICNATLEDSDLNLAEEIINALGAAIGIALDKAILYGFGTKMPLGIAPRLAQAAEPSDYPANARPWVDLHASNIITIDSSKHGIDFYKEIVTASGAMKSKYSTGGKFWVMNETTYTKLKVEAMTFNSAGAILAVQDGTMPVAGGEIITLSDDIIANDVIIAGYGDLYLLAERAGSTFARSDEYRFAEDQVAFKGTARYDGLPVIPEGFIIIGLGAAPATSAVFAGDTANDASLQELTLGSETLSPVFATGTYAYAVTASGTSGAVNATANQSGAKIDIAYNGKRVNNGASVTFAAGTNDLVITVKNGLGSLTYTVTITKA
ncbi:phage major capsid protein [Lacrimispora sp.]|uniref:phage major capsid protein n=1 Tax=Lacrimispora sp. TaxID=2719234 RepID=UPI0026D8C9DE|nr:phage major capsid protein [Lacrimispora sp.]